MSDCPNNVPILADKTGLHYLRDSILQECDGVCVCVCVAHMRILQECDGVCVCVCARARACVAHTHIPQECETVSQKYY